MMIYQREPVFTIGQAPFVAAAIHVRNQIRVFKQREKARRRKAFVEHISSLHDVIPRYLASPRSEPDWRYTLAHDRQRLTKADGPQFARQSVGVIRYQTIRSPKN